ncbi:hypothetical protein QTP70_015681 [Hemibagrus guttatus]|uniref:Endonuclease/exonuclease/phosphatase domain-containing protein n=1 Tax=Hemibagrus guttatus TaxID=175788 RepID=A0AAE0UU84_9TELE|nr:hypothetical protein QTP70_015681 [Hemibagrus guttatus]
MTGKGRELADMMERRKVDILCVQETRWKGSKARSIGAGFKLFYYGVDSKRNGVGVVLKEELVRNVLEVKRVSDRVMSLKLEIEGVMLNVVSGYAPQVGCELEEKERFWSELDEVMESIPTGERVVIGADFNGHVGEGNTGDEEVMGKFGVKERNLEGQMVVDFAKRMDMAVVNTYFQKREEHRVTYKSGGRRTQVDYILCRRGNLKEISDCKVVVGESVARQHRMVVCRMTLMVCKKKRSKIEKKTKWWKLKKEECCEEFRQKLRQALGGQVVLPDDWETTAEVIRETGRKVLGVSSGRRKEDKETWWWNEEVQDSIQRKRLAKKKWDMDRTEENRQEYKGLQRRVKREVSKAKQKAYDELYTRLDTREGEKDLYRIARQRDRDGKDVQQVRVIKDRDGRVLTSEESVQRRWKEYFEELMNEENEREKRVEGVNSVEQKVDKIRKDEVRKALKRMKSGKAVGPDDIPVEVWKCLGEAAVEFLASLFNRVLESERMPEEWRRSVLVPIFKNKGDVQSCSNYRGIKLMSHTMKVWERVVEARLRKVVEICEQQYGFMPRKSTTDAIFALRILMEKYRDGQRELHCLPLARVVTEPPPLGTPPGVLRRGRPLGRRAGLLGWSRWKSSTSDGFRMSTASTHERSSGPYPSQSMRHCRQDRTHLEFRRARTWYAGDPSMSRGGGGSSQALASLAAGCAGLSRDTWKFGHIRELKTIRHRIYLADDFKRADELGVEFPAGQLETEDPS